MEKENKKNIDYLAEQSNRLRVKYLILLDIYYTRSKSADTDKLVDLIKAIKGNMSLADFGKIVGTTPGNLSRIINGKMTTSLRKSMIAGLAAAAEINPNCTITLEDLAKANGMTDKRKDSTVETQKRMISFDAWPFLTSVKKEISYELMLSGVKIGAVQDSKSPISYEEMDIADGKFNLILNDLQGDTSISSWAFIIIDHSFDDYDQELSNSKVLKILMQIYAYFYSHNSDKVDKISIVTSQKEDFSSAVNHLTNKSFTDKISIILTDESGEHLLDEYCADCSTTKNVQIFGVVNS